MRLLRRWGREESRPVPARRIVEALKASFRELRPSALAAQAPSARPLGWILSVPDAQQRTLLAALAAEPALRTLACASEDEANAIAAGLWIGGEPCALSIQHSGLYASLNSLLGVGIDGRVPLFLLIGLRGRERDRDPRESRSSLVRHCEPLLDTFAVPYARLERPDDVQRIPELFRLAHERRGPAAVLVGRETC
jgi:sulfopyruvate decarboxylase TPP-binding subunit